MIAHDLNDKLHPSEQILVQIPFETKPSSEICCPSCNAVGADERCPSCGTMIWHPGHLISRGGDYEDGI